jgi:hypothetical protein
MGSGSVSKGMMCAVERHLTEEGRTPKQIHEALDLWSLISVRAALRQLVEEGRASFTGTNCNRLYRRVQQ